MKNEKKYVIFFRIKYVTLLAPDFYQIANRNFRSSPTSKFFTSSCLVARKHEHIKNVPQSRTTRMILLMLTAFHTLIF